MKNMNLVTTHAVLSEISATLTHSFFSVWQYISVKAHELFPEECDGKVFN